MFNHVALLGRLAQSPEVKYGEGGVPRATFDLAVQTPSKDHNTPPDYIPIVCWRDQADMAARYLSKGRQIVVEGRITTRKYTDNEGRARKVVEVTASRLFFTDSREAGGDTGAGYGPTYG